MILKKDIEWGPSGSTHLVLLSVKDMEGVGPDKYF